MVLTLCGVLVQARTLASARSLVRLDPLLADRALIDSIVLALAQAPFLPAVLFAIIIEFAHILFRVVTLATVGTLSAPVRDDTSTARLFVPAEVSQ